jgi:hypothetical protein
MKILITGSNGVIGKFLTKKLKDHDVFIPKRSCVDFTNREHVDKFFQSHLKFDLVLHCSVVGANRIHQDSWNVLDDNLKMYYNILHNKNNYDKFISFGSGAEIYMQDTPYGLSKKSIAKSILDQYNFYNIRIFGLFGEGELDSRFIKSNLERYKNNQPIQIYQNQLIRAYVLNIIEFDPAVTFHLHANFFDVYPSGMTMTPSVKTDVLTMGVAERHILEFAFKYPGKYMFHPHQDAIAESGCMGQFAVISEKDS